MKILQSILLNQGTMIGMLLLKEIRPIVRLRQAAVLEKGFSTIFLSESMFQFQ